MIRASELEGAAATVAALDTLVYSIEDAVSDIAARLQDHESARSVALIESVAPVLERALASADINLPGEEAENGLDWSPAERLLADVAAQISTAEVTTGTIADRAVSSVSQHIADILPGNTDILGALVRAISELVGGVLGSIDESPDLWKALFDVFHGELGPRANPVGKWVTGLFEGLLESAAERRADDGKLAAALSKAKADSPPNTYRTVEDIIAQFESQPWFMRAILNLITLIASVYPIATSQSAALVSGLTQNALAQGTPTPLSPAELAELVRRDFVGYPWAVEHAKRSGTSPELFKHKLDLTDRYLAPDAIMTFWRYTGDDSVLDQLRKLGYDEANIERLKRLALAEATPADVVRFLARDVTDPAAVTSGNLSKDFAQKYDKALFDKAGVSKELAELYWRAHWQLPSPTQGFEMYHRGKLTLTELTSLLEYADYAPAYVQKLIDIAYNVPGRIDVRRMWEVGVITTRAELEERYQHMGYSPADAVTIANFTEVLADKAKRNELERRVSGSTREIVRSFMVGTLSRVFAESALISLGHTQARATELIAGAVFGRERDRADRIRDAIGKAYVRGYSTQEEAEQKLLGYGFGSDEISFLMDSWNLDRELADDTEAKRAERDLTKTEIIGAYEDRITTREEAHRGLMQAGYDADESNTLLQLADNKRQRTDNAVAERAVHAQFVNRRITAIEARNTLQGFGYLDTRVAALMARWEVEREEKRPDISASQLQKMLEYGIVPAEQVETMLRERGYSERDVSLMMTLYGTDMSIAADKLAEQRRQFEIRERRLTEQGAARIGLTERSLDIRERQFDASQEGLQARFDAAQEQQRNLQQQRLDSATVLQASRLAAQTARDAQSFQAARERQARDIEARIAAQDKQIAAANARAEAANAARAKALEQQRELAALSQAEQNARLAANLTAQADRQQVAIDAAARRAEQQQAVAFALQEDRQAAQEQLAVLRGLIQEARDIRLKADAIEKEQRAEQAAVRKESRADARKQISTAEAAANAAALQSLQLQQGALVAELESRFAALQAQLAQARQQSALDAKLAAERLLAAATPPSSLLGSAGY